MTRSSRRSSLLILAALALGVTACAGTAGGDIPCIEDVTCPDQYPVCGPSGTCTAGSSREKASVAIACPEGYKPTAFVKGAFRMLVPARAVPGVAGLNLGSGSPNLRASP